MRLRTIQLSTAVVLISALVATFSAVPANADTTSAAIAPSVASVHESLVNAQSVTSDWDSIPSTETQRAVEDNARALETHSGLDLDVNASVGWAVDDNSILIQVPVSEGQGAIYPSAISLFVDRSGQVTDVVESIFTPVSSASGHVQAWVNGVLQVDEIVSEVGPGTVAGDAAAGVISPTAAWGSGEWWSALNSCLAAQGIPAWVVTSLSIICAAACVVTAGAGCAICIAAAAGLGTGVVYLCVEFANQA